MSNVLFQDNQSAIRIERNGRNSCTGNSRHIDVRYFWVKDVVDRKEIKIEYCPTEQMLADYFTKPLNGRLFKYFRDIIMGYIPIRELIEKTRSKMKERVENKEKLVSKVVSNDIKSNHAKIVERQKMTYAEAVKMQNRECMEEMKQHLTPASSH